MLQCISVWKSSYLPLATCLLDKFLEHSFFPLNFCSALFITVTKAKRGAGHRSEKPVVIIDWATRSIRGWRNFPSPTCFGALPHCLSVCHRVYSTVQHYCSSKMWFSAVFWTGFAFAGTLVGGMLCSWVKHYARIRVGTKTLFWSFAKTKTLTKDAMVFAKISILQKGVLQVVQ
jgi:hypothetical protein